MISSTEVERAVCALEPIAECAAVGVPSELGEWDVKLVVVAQPGTTVDTAEFVRHCQQTLPDFCQPRYLEVLDELPKGPTHRVNKHQLRHTDAPTVVDLSRGGAHSRGGEAMESSGPPVGRIVAAGVDAASAGSA